jgi:MFS family permease
VKAAIYRATNMWRVLSWLALVVCCFLLDGTALLVAFAICIVPISIGAGIAGLPRTVMTAKTIPPNRRGALFSWRNSGAAVLGILAGPIVAFILGGNVGLGFPMNFGLVFLLGSMVFVGGYVLMGAVSDAPDSPPESRPNFGQQLSRAISLVRNSQVYRGFLGARLLATFGFACAPFFAVIARRVLSLDASYLGYFVVTSQLSGLIGNFLFARLGDRHGHRVVMFTGALSGLLLALVGVVLATGSTPAVPSLFAAYAVIGLTSSALQISFSPLMMEVTPGESRPLYYGFTHTAMGLGVIISGAVGLLADVLGYAGLYAVCLMLFALAAALMAIQIRAPATDAN